MKTYRYKASMHNKHRGYIVLKAEDVAEALRKAQRLLAPMNITAYVDFMEVWEDGRFVSAKRSAK